MRMQQPQQMRGRSAGMMNPHSLPEDGVPHQQMYEDQRPMREEDEDPSTVITLECVSLTFLFSLISYLTFTEAFAHDPELLD